jgi:hypothetical protein
MRNRKSLLLLALLLSTGAAGLAVAADTPVAGDKPARAKLDTNGDGFIDRAEAAKAPRLAAQFFDAVLRLAGELTAGQASQCLWAAASLLSGGAGGGAPSLAPLADAAARLAGDFTAAEAANALWAAATLGLTSAAVVEPLAAAAARGAAAFNAQNAANSLWAAAATGRRGSGVTSCWWPAGATSKSWTSICNDGSLRPDGPGRIAARPQRPLAAARLGVHLDISAGAAHGRAGLGHILDGPAHARAQPAAGDAQGAGA